MQRCRVWQGSILEKVDGDGAIIGINHFGRWRLPEALRALARHGYRAVDYSAAAGRLAGDADALATVRRLTRDLGLRPAATHFRSFGFSFLAPAERYQAFCHQSVEDVRVAAYLGAPAIAFHLGNDLGGGTDVAEHDPSRTRELPQRQGSRWRHRFEPVGGAVPAVETAGQAGSRTLVEALAAANAEALRPAVQVAEQEGVVVALENHCHGFGDRWEHLAAVADLLGSPAVGFTLDSGHAVVAGQDPARLARQMGLRLALTHLHDNDGTADTHRPAGRSGPNGEQAGGAVVDWPALIRALQEVRYPERNHWILEGGTQVPGDDVDRLLAAHLASFSALLRSVANGMSRE